MRKLKQFTYEGNISIERLPHSGALVLSAFDGNQLVNRTYFGFTRKEAIYQFRQFLKKERKKS